jgi:putative DNA-invertase from lambdoid prophage Rac
MSKRMRAGLYARVSSADQQTLPMQIAAMKEYAERRGWEVSISVQDIGSGAKERPKHQELLKMAKRGKIEVVLVWRLDRWGRSLHDVVTSLQELIHAGVAFVSVSESIDLTTPTGKAMAGMIALFAEFERAILRERVLAGMAAARKKGKIFGRPATARAKADKIERLHLEGVSKHEIARRLKITPGSVRNVLRLCEAEKTRDGIDLVGAGRYWT